MPEGLKLVNFQLLLYIADLIEELAEQFLSRKRGILC
jgi:hypothetical protein